MGRQGQWATREMLRRYGVAARCAVCQTRRPSGGVARSLEWRVLPERRGRPLRGLGYIRGLRSFLTLGNFELYRIAFLQALVAFGANRAVVNKYVCPIRAADEPVSLGVIEPLHGSFQTFHVIPPSSCTSFRWGNPQDMPAVKMPP